MTPTEQPLIAHTIVIGLSRFSVDVLESVRERFAALHVGRHLDTLALLADAQDRPAASESASPASNPPKQGYDRHFDHPIVEKATLGRLYYKESTRVWCAPHWRKWSQHDFRMNRVYGRLWIHDCFGDIKIQLSALQASIVTDDTASSRLNVFLVVPLYDNFASGAWLDLAYLLSDHYRYNERVHVYGILVLPTSDHPSTHEQDADRALQIRHANVYAALRELNFALHTPSFYDNHHPQYQIVLTDTPPFTSGQCFLVGGSKDEHDSPQPLTYQHVKQTCAYMMLLMAQQGVTAGQAAMPTLYEEQIGHLTGVSSFGMVIHRQTLQEDTEQQRIVTTALLDHLIEGSVSRRAAALIEYDDDESNRLVEQFQSAYDEAEQAANNSAEARRYNDSIIGLKSVASLATQDQQYSEALQALTAYQITFAKEVTRAEAQGKEQVKARVSDLLQSSGSLRAILEQFNNTRPRLERRLNQVQAKRSAAQEAANGKIKELRLMRARRLAFAVAPIAALLPMALIGVFLFTTVLMNYFAGWLNGARGLVFVVALVGSGAYLAHRGTHNAFQTRLRVTQQDLLNLQKQVVQARQECIYWQALTENTLNAQQSDGIDAGRIGRLLRHADALRVQQRASFERTPQIDRLMERIAENWSSIAHPVDRIFKAWLEDLDKDTAEDADAPDRLASTLTRFAAEQGLYEIGESVRALAKRQLEEVAQQVACLLAPKAQHPSLAEDQRSLNNARRGSGLVMRLGFLSKEGRFVPLPETIYSGEFVTTRFTSDDIPQPAENYRAVALRVRGGIPLPSLSDLRMWNQDYLALGKILVNQDDWNGTNEIKPLMKSMRAFFHPTRAGMVTPDLLQPSSKPAPFPYLLLVVTLLRHLAHDDQVRIWKSLADQYEVKYSPILAKTGGQGLTLPTPPIDLDQLACALQEQATPALTELLSVPSLSIPPRPTFGEREWDFPDLSEMQPIMAIVLGSQQSVDEIIVRELQAFIRVRGQKRASEIAADWEAWVLRLLDVQLEIHKNRIGKNDADPRYDQRRHLIHFAYILLKQWVPLEQPSTAQVSP